MFSTHGQRRRGGDDGASAGWILVVGDGLLADLAGSGRRAVSRFLRRAAEHRLPPCRPEDVAGWAVTGHHSPTAAWAPAPVTWRADFGDEAPLGVVRADPVRLSAGPSGVAVHPPEGLRISPAEARRMCSAVADALGDRIVSCRAAAPDRWYLTMTAVPEGPWWTPGELGERDLIASLPPDGEGTDLKVLLNEIQVVLHQQEDNVRRREQGLPEVNSVWLWGWSQRPPARVGCQASAVYSSHPYATGLAQLAGVATQGIGEPPEPLCGTGVVVAAGGNDDDAAALWGERLARALTCRQIDRLRVVTWSGRRFDGRARRRRLPWPSAGRAG